MANRNTIAARHAGYSGMKRMMTAGTSKDYGQKTGQKVNSSERRKESGKRAWVGGSPPRKPRRDYYNSGS